MFTEMSFPNLIPAFVTHIVLDPAFSIGDISSGGPLTVVPFASEDSYLRSVENYPIKVDAIFVHGSDFIRQDPSGSHIRLNVNSVLRDRTSALLSFKYDGIIKVTPYVAAVLGGSPDTASTEFGDAFTHVVFEAGAEELKALEQKVYVAAGRFIVGKGKKTIVEYLISEVGI
ncbi:hypothetical protein B0O99DRAFT_323597 [Bisporella sp. PMI_857]|nr:hypothetical protein B0O99DRAFT_369371 [Bisporella sp. PMI_857]KAH8600369.1 hypothetical protein B0O99DRAFT_323597 [Bisporella sp. PMI_857]